MLHDPQVASPDARRSYAPLRHPGVRDRWTRAAILDAVAAWTQETGRPPRRREWTGERPHAAGAGQRKWMREHPRWPSASCVTRHFGAWSTALRTAGLPARSLVFDTTAETRVHTARRLARGGMPIGAISDRLGVSPSTVYRYLNARSCPQCGGVLPSPLAERCRDCSRSAPTITRSWTRAEVRAAIAEWHALTGRAPSYRDWTPSRSRTGRWARESPRWPSASVVCDLYADAANPWNAALQDAGAPVRFRRWSDDAIRETLAAFHESAGHRPSAGDLRAAGWDGPHPKTLQRRFGSVDDAWRQLNEAGTPAER